MRKITLFIMMVITLNFIPACDILQQLEIPVPQSLTEEEIVKGLKEALRIGTQNGINILNQENGFFGDSLLRIPFPEDVRQVEIKLRALGFGRQIDQFVLTMNRGAEKAVKKAGPIFIDAITQMTISDARNILQGPDNAATQYFRNKTEAQLIDAFKPDVKATLDQIHVTKLWSDLTTTYNKIPFTKDVETDLPLYVTGKAVDGLFIKVAEEEMKIRTDPVARVSDILKKVFGSQI